MTIILNRLLFLIQNACMPTKLFVDDSHLFFTPFLGSFLPPSKEEDQMSEPGRYVAAIFCACLATYSFSDRSGLSIYIRVSIISLLLYSFASLIYNKFIYPFYTSPLLGLPFLPVSPRTALRNLADLGSAKNMERLLLPHFTACALGGDGDCP